MTGRPPRRRHRAGSHWRYPGCGCTPGSQGCDPDLRPTVHPWGSEPWFVEPGWATDSDEPLDPLPQCPTCHVELDRPHHDFCDKAWCWSCQSQALGCDHGVALEEEGGQ